MASISESDRKRVWARVQKDMAFLAPSSVREYIDEQAGPVQDSEDLEDYEGTVRSLLGVAKMQAVSRCLPSQKSKSCMDGKGRRKVYAGPLQKRSYLVSFVIDQHLTMKPRRSASSRRFNWKQICDQWNAQSRPYEAMAPLRLKAKYYKAAADKEVQRTFFAKQANLLLLDLERSLDEGRINRGVIDNLMRLMKMRRDRMPSLFEREYVRFLRLMVEALESSAGVEVE